MRTLLVVAGTLLSVLSASASDYFTSYNYDRLFSRTPSANWTGPYAGLTFGYGWGRLEATSAFATVVGMGTAQVPLGGFSTRNNSWNGGLTAGYNFYASNVVFGGEADLSYGRHRHDSGRLTFNGVLAPGDAFSGNFGAGINWFSTIRGRIGYLLTPQAMVYATGGLAAASTSAHVSYTYNDGLTTTTGSFRDSRVGWGWTAGVGIEDRFAENVSMKVEYLYLSLPRHRFRFSEPGIVFGFEGRARIHMLRAGLNYHF